MDFLPIVFVLSTLGTFVSSSPHGPIEADKVSIRQSPVIVSASTTCSAISPPPSHYLCGTPGNLVVGRTDDPVTSTQITSLEACRDFCLHEALTEHAPLSYYSRSCQRFTYNAETKVCKLLNSNSTTEYNRNQSSTRLFYDKECFQCDKRCPQSQTINLIDNGGFEISNQHIGPWSLISPGSTKGLITSPGHNSSKAFICPAGKAQCQLIQYRSLCFGSLYTFKADVKSVPREGTDTSQRASLEIFIDEYLEYSVLYNATGRWQTIFATFEPHFAQDTTGIDITMIPYGYDLYIDNIEVLRAPSAFPTTGDSLVTNGGFETGSLAPWKFRNINNYDPKAGHYGITSPGLTEGNYKFQFHSPTYGEGHGYSDTGPVLTQDIPTVPGTRYLVSFDFLQHTRVTDPGGAYPAVTLYSVTFGSATWVSESHRDVPKNKTAHFAMVATAEDAVTSLEVSVDVFGPYGTHLGVDLDNIQVKALA